MKKNIGDTVCIWVFPLLSLLLAAGISLANPQAFEKGSVARIYVQNAFQGKTGYGCEGYYGNQIDFSGLEPGDLILGSYPECSYGHYSHAGLYLGKGEVLEGFVDMGVNIQNIEHYRQYAEVCLLRVTADEKTKNRAVQYARNHQGCIFYPLAFKPGDRIFNCTKIMWQAYKIQGLDLAPDPNLWISPDCFRQNANVELIREESI